MNKFSQYGDGSAKAMHRLAHIKDHLDGGFDVAGYIANIERGTGDPAACAGRLSSHAYAQAMNAWFNDARLEGMKNWFYIAECLRRFQLLHELNTANFLHRSIKFMAALVSDNEPVINWFCNLNEIVDAKRVKATTTADFLAYQIRLAVNGDFALLEERCKRMSEKPPAGPKKIFLLDNDFFLALAYGDKAAMEVSLHNLTLPSLIKKRLDMEGGYSEGLISSFGVIYAKIAWRHGYQVTIDTPYIPAEWLPVRPLDHYDVHYDFLKSRVDEI